MKSFLVGMLAMGLFMVPFYILSAKLNIVWEFWEQLCIMLSLSFACTLNRISDKLMSQNK